MARNKDADASGTKKKKAKGQGRIAQIRQIYQATKATDPAIGWWMLLAFLGTVAVFVLIGFLFDLPLIFGLFGLLFGPLAATIVMSRRAERAAYASIEGQPGAAGAALGSIRKGWYTDREPVAADVARGGEIANAAVVYRALGRPGVVLVGEGPAMRVEKLLLSEKKRVERVAPGVPVTTFRVGRGEGEVPVGKIANKVQRLRPKITKDEMSLVNKRLKALGGLRAPLPKGVDPTRARMDRRALRGR